MRWLSFAIALGLGSQLSAHADSRPVCEERLAAGVELSASGHAKAAIAALEDARACAAAVSSLRLEALSLQQIAQAREAQGDLAGARDYILDALAVGAESSDPRTQHEQAVRQQLLARILSAADQSDAAVQVWRGLLDEADRASPVNPAKLAYIRSKLGDDLWESGDKGGAERNYQEAIRILEVAFEKDAGISGFSLPYERLAELHEDQGRYLESAALYASAVKQIDVRGGNAQAIERIRTELTNDRCRVLALAGGTAEECHSQDRE